MATNPDIREEIPSIDPLPSLSSASQAILMLPFSFPMLGIQTTGPSASHFTFSGTSTTSSILQPEYILQLQTRLASLQAMLAQQSVPVVSTVNTYAPRLQFTVP